MSVNELREKPKLRYRLIAAILAVLWAALIFTLSAIPAESYPAHPGFLNYVAHFCEYAIFAALLTTAIFGPKRKLWLSALIAVVIASLFGSSDELHQYFVPGRDSSPIDWLTDTIGAIVGAITTLLLTSYRIVKRSREKDAKLGL